MWPEGNIIRIGRPLNGLCLVPGSPPLMAGPLPHGTNRETKHEVPRTKNELLIVETKNQELINQNALAQSHQRGYVEGHEDGLRKIESVLAALETGVEAMRSEQERIHQSSTETAVTLALEIAAKLLERELAHPDAIRAAVMNALKLAPQGEAAAVRLNPQTSSALHRALAACDGQGLPSNVTLIEDYNIEPGGCIIQCSVENWDAQPSARLRLIAEALASGDTAEGVKG